MTPGDINTAFEKPYRKPVVKTFLTGTSMIGTNSSYHLSRKEERGAYIYGFRKNSNASWVPGGVMASKIADDATMMNNLAVMNHGDVKDNQVWRDIYHRQKRKLLFSKGVDTGEVKLQGEYWSYPCGYCGLVLPEQLIQVDHRQPQQFPAVAIMKVIRAIDAVYAEGASTGQKAGQVGAFARGTHMTKMVVGKHDFGTTFDQRMPSSADEDLQKRYTLSLAGEIFLTVCSMVWGAQNLQNVCLNNILNLVPACAQCNGGAGKGGYPYMHP